MSHLPVPFMDETGAWILEGYRHHISMIAGVDIRLAMFHEEQCQPRINAMDAWLLDHGCSYHEFQSSDNIIEQCQIHFPNEAVALMFRLTWYQGCEPT